MGEIEIMFKRFISTKPLFEKLQYRYLGAQKEADFIFKQFQINSIFAEYEKSKEVLKNYAEVANSIRANKNSKILAFIGTVFTFITVCRTLDNIPKNMSAFKPHVKSCMEAIKAHWLPVLVFVLIILVFITPLGRCFQKFIDRIKAKE
ncbi:MAG: hypothetical protein K2I74_06145 [Treponemataceae bacterium]|nr:hypothetical protein [Treponemataceae bacterium]